MYRSIIFFLATSCDVQLRHTTRHDIIVQKLATFIRSASGSVFLEPKHSDEKRADAQVFFPADTSLVDVTVCHPAAPFYTTNTASTSLGAARFRERQKHLKYDGQAKADCATFFPFVLETYGGFGA